MVNEMQACQSCNGAGPGLTPTPTEAAPNYTIPILIAGLTVGLGLVLSGGGKK